jgi:hypothetical protein
MIIHLRYNDFKPSSRNYHSFVFMAGNIERLW